MAKLSCSFCDKPQNKVKKLIAGPAVYICDECVDLCLDIISESEDIDVRQLHRLKEEKVKLEGEKARLEEAITSVKVRIKKLGQEIKETSQRPGLHPAK